MNGVEGAQVGRRSPRALQRKRAVIDDHRLAETSALDAVVQALRERPGAALRAAA